MKAILMSIKPEECEKIFSGEKTVEVRKTAPKLNPPFKVYVYQTKNRRGNKVINEALNAVYGGGKVVGEFVCDRVEENIPDYNPAYERFFYNSFECGADCLTSDEIAAYGKSDSLRGLHIAKPKRYDKPKELGEFRKPCEYASEHYACYPDNCARCPWNTVTRPPQSWCYVEEIEE